MLGGVGHPSMYWSHTDRGLVAALTSFPSCVTHCSELSSPVNIQALSAPVSFRGTGVMRAHQSIQGLKSATLHLTARFTGPPQG